MLHRFRTRSGTVTFVMERIVVVAEHARVLIHGLPAACAGDIRKLPAAGLRLVYARRTRRGART